MNTEQMTAPERLCSVQGCSRVHYGKSFCKMHYGRWRRNGHTERIKHPFADVGPKVDISGQRYGRLTVTSYDRESMWNCVCDCGNATVQRGYSLKKGLVVSCGCFARKADGKSREPEYVTWMSMQHRCNKPNNIGYKDYGGRGIRVEYASYEAFLDDVGRRPSPQHSIDRIDNNKNYAPGNCRWATCSEQANNTRRNVVLRYKGRDMTIAELARKTGVNYNTLRQRITVNKLSPEQAVSTPNMRGKSFG